jgi:photosystem II stability/assembly factor-like uncharacterized protein
MRAKIISFLIIVSISTSFLYCQKYHLDAGPDLNLTCFDEVMLNGQIQNWMIKSEFPYSLKSICILNDTLGYAAGGGMWNESQILKTIDGGEKWFILHDTISIYIEKIFFLNVDTGFILSNYPAYIYKTIDGGQTWNRVTDIYYSILEAVDFINDTIGFAGGNSPILKTTDGGDSWVEIESPISLYHDILFINDSIGFAVSHGDTNYYNTIGHLIETRDGGNTWKEVNLSYSFSLNALSYNDNKIFIACNEGQIISSDNFFETWSIYQTQKFTSLNDIHFIDSLVGFAVGKQNAIFVTTDGGITWNTEYAESNVDIHEIDNFQTSEIYAVGYIPGNIVDTGVIIRYNELHEQLHYQWFPSEHLSNDTILNPVLSASEIDQYVLSATDSMEINMLDTISISTRTPSIFAGEDLSLAFGDTAQLSAYCETGRWEIAAWGTAALEFNDVVFLNSDTGFISGSGGTGGILRTTDGGETWKALNTGISSGMFEMSFINDHIGYVAGTWGRIYKTNDCGENWSALTTCTTEQLERIYFINEQIGYAAGWNGTIIKTTDGGNTWYNQNSTVDAIINKIYFINENRGFAGTTFDHDCAILETFNGGETWIQKPLETERYMDITDIQFFNDSLGYMIGGSLTPFGFFKTENGGQTWKVTIFERDDYPIYTSMYFFDRYTGYVTTAIGEILSTVDGGETWSLLSIDWSLYIKAITFNDAHNGFAVGVGGLILQYHEASNIHFNWYPETNILLPQSAHPFVFPKESTTYSVVVSDEIGCSTSDEVLVSVNPMLNDEHKESEHILSIYPNPSINSFILKINPPFNGECIINIYDLNGITVYQKQIFIKEDEFQIKHDLNPGQYVVEIQYQEQKYSEMIIIK